MGALFRCTLALALASVPAAADVLVLKDGTIVQDRPLERADDGVHVVYDSGKVLVPSELVHVLVVAGQDDFQPTSDAEREKLAKGLVLFDGEWMPAKKRDQLIAKRSSEREAEILDNLAHREWKDRRKAETKNFRFEYTVPQHVFDNYSERMEAYYQAFAKDWKIKPPKNGKLSVCFYASPKEFHRTSGASYGVAAYFKFVEPYDLNVYHDKLDAVFTEQVLYHEANHYLQKLIDEGFKYPHFPGESLAEYYGASTWDPAKKKLTVGLLQEGRLAEIQDDIARGERMGLEKLLTGEGQYEDYTWGWSLVHYLMNASSHRDAFQRFYVGLALGKDVRRVPASFGLVTVEPDELAASFRKHLGLKSQEQLAALESAWHAWLDETIATGLTTRGKEKGALKALSTGRKLRAKRLFQEAIEAGSENALVHHKYASLLEKEDAAQALELWRRAVTLAPLTGTYWLALGRALEDTDKAESERLKKLALEIDPELDEDAFVWDF
jgi:tetratricopeptide (TPR) repeat protein